MAGGPPGPEEIKRALYLIRCTQIFFCAMYAVVVWDWLVCLPQEYKQIWKRKLTVPSYLYFGSRYLILFTMPVILWINSNEEHTIEQCKTLHNVPPLISMWYQGFAAAILLVRTHAFLGQKLPVLIGLCSTLAAVFIYQIYVAVAQMAPLPFLQSPGLTGPCLPTVRYDGSPHVALWFIAPLIFDVLVAGMTITKAFHIHALGGSENRLLRIFLREGILYFILISISNIINGVFNALPDHAVGALIVPLSVGFPSIVACRLVLDLRKQGTPVFASSQQGSNGRALPGGTGLPPKTRINMNLNQPVQMHHTTVELSDVVDASYAPYTPSKGRQWQE